MALRGFWAAYLGCRLLDWSHISSGAQPSQIHEVVAAVAGFIKNVLQHGLKVLAEPSWQHGGIPGRPP